MHFANCCFNSRAEQSHEDSVREAAAEEQLKQIKESLQAPSPFSELRSCVKVEVAVLGSPSLISLMVSVDVKQH